MIDPIAWELLPKQATTPYELANLGAHVEAWPLDVQAVARQSDPMLCDLANLPFLAFERGLILWNDAWDEATKRRYVRDAWIYKRLEGTPLGVEAYLNLAGAALVAELLPPADSFAIDDDALTRQQLLDLMPQLRLYHQWPQQFPARGTVFADVGFADVGFAVPDSAVVLGLYPVLFDPATGAETPLAVADVSQTANTVTLVRPGFGAGAAFADVSFADGFSYLGDPIGQDPIVINLGDPAMVTVRGSQPLPRSLAVADVSFADSCFAGPDAGDAATYDRLYLWDASRIPVVHSVARSAAFADVSWVGLPAYWQILTVAMPGTPSRARPGTAFADACIADADAFAFDASDQAEFDFAMTAISLARRSGDRVLVQLASSFAGTRAATLPSMEDI